MFHIFGKKIKLLHNNLRIAQRKGDANQIFPGGIYNFFNGQQIVVQPITLHKQHTALSHQFHINAVKGNNLGRPQLGAN